MLDGKPPALSLDSFFALNPAMPNLHRLYKEQQATIVHATATPRERSHFDGQDVVESGMAKPGAVDNGWLKQLAPDGGVDPRGRRAMAVGPVTPLVVRGPAPVMSWAPQILPASDDTQTRLLNLYQHTDPRLAAALEGRMRLVALGRSGGTDASNATAAQLPPPGIARVRAYFADAAGTVARYLVRPDGPRVGAMGFGFVGWDTHLNEGGAAGQLAGLLGALDGALAAVETNMGEAWGETVVAVITEFGRTARINGTDGTDHGTGTVALLAGGALKGGRVVADWPGLKPAARTEAADGDTSGPKTADALRNLAWHPLIARGFAEAPTERARALAASQVWMETDQGHASLFLGSLRDARKIYHAHKERPADRTVAGVDDCVPITFGTGSLGRTGC